MFLFPSFFLSFSFSLSLLPSLCVWEERDRERDRERERGKERERERERERESERERVSERDRKCVCVCVCVCVCGVCVCVCSCSSLHSKSWIDTPDTYWLANRTKYLMNYLIKSLTCSHNCSIDLHFTKLQTMDRFDKLDLVSFHGTPLTGDGGPSSWLHIWWFTTKIAGTSFFANSYLNRVHPFI